MSRTRPAVEIASGVHRGVGHETDHRTSGRRRFPVDPLVVLVGIVAAVVYGSHGFEGFLSRDLGVYTYGAQRVVEGVPPYVGILTRAGPLGQLLPALGIVGADLVGITELLGMRLLYCGIAVASVCVVYLLGRDVFGSRLGGLAGAAAFLTFEGFIELATNGPREKTPLVLFLACALLLAVRRRWLLAGVSAGLVALTWQPGLLVALAGVLVAALAVPGRRRLRAVALVVVGGLLTAVATLVYFAAAGALREFLDAFLVINARYTSSLPFTSTLDNWTRLRRGFGVGVWVLLVGLLSAVALAVLASVRRRAAGDRRAPVVASGVAAAVSVAWTLYAYNNWPDAFVLLPFAAVGVAGLVAALTRRMNRAAAASLVVVWVAACVAVALMYSLGEQDHRLRAQRAGVARMLEQLPPDPVILSVQAPHVLVLTETTNPTRHQMFSGGLERYVDDTWPGGLEGYADWVAREEPTAIVLGGRTKASWLRDTLESEYAFGGRAVGWVWYVHRSVAGSGE